MIIYNASLVRLRVERHDTGLTFALVTPHVGIDEWAWHRSHHYGMLIFNLDIHRPLALLPGHDQCTLLAVVE